ncbi:SRPBCC domain-containing protein [Aliiroseovarius subalbicans]|uniref:SRPBCC family protein n=1 Tax=Aliiroseovarius subalbicans TaxID=2925840 RepID=UPI001F575D2E|nr:SRPBCC domain-containing protein [Aliiroseovarius subalbicans]MCI2398567.1 SRPBCC domain-containing protein [Aliiroseovarius subalbicans]
MNNTISKTIFLQADKAEVWDFLTQPDKLAIWFHAPKQPLSAGEYAMYGADSGDKLMWGDVSVFEPHDRLEYTFSITPMNGATSQVKWKLDAVAGGTRLSLEHSGLPDSVEAFGLSMALDKGWDEHFARMRSAIHG